MDSDTQSATQSYGEWLAEQVDALSVTQARLAQEAKVHPLTISNIVNGKTEPQTGSREKIKQALDRLSRKERQQPLIEPAPKHDPSARLSETFSRPMKSTSHRMNSVSM